MSSHVEYHRFRKEETCLEEGCRARKFYIEDGKKFCQRGHEQTGFTQTQQDEDDWNAQGKKSRKKRAEKEQVDSILSGSEARELYLQCYQLILWKQCHWLVSIKEFPPELETVIRDLWDLRTRSLHMREEKSGYGSTVGTILFSSQSEGETEYDTDATDRRSLSSRRSRRSSVSEGKLPRLVETLGLCYLGILLLRLPTSLGEVYKWATQDEMIYIRAIKELPREMRSKLPPHYHAALQVRAPLKEATIYGTVMELVGFYHTQFEMIFPPLNSSLLLFKHVRDLGLPIEVIPAVRRLADILDIDFSFFLEKVKTYHVTIHPEIQLVSLMVIATKLSHPFDELSGLPTSESDPTIMKIDWAKWTQIMAEKDPDGIKRGREIYITEEYFCDTSDHNMDEYLDWFQRTWIDDNKQQKMPAQILELFPLNHLEQRPPEPLQTKACVSKLKTVHESLIVLKSWPEAGDGEEGRVKRSGELYKRYRKLEGLPEAAKPFFELAAFNAGISVKMLVRGVFLLEKRIESWLVKERKKKMVKENERENEDDW